MKCSTRCGKGLFRWQVEERPVLMCFFGQISWWMFEFHKTNQRFQWGLENGLDSQKNPSHEWTSRLGLLHEDDHYTGGTGGKCVRKKTSSVSDESRDTAGSWSNSPKVGKLEMLIFLPFWHTFPNMGRWWFDYPKFSPCLTFSPLNWRDCIASPDAKTSMSLVGSCSNFQKTHPIIHKS